MNFEKHYEESLVVPTKPEEVFNFADDHNNFSSHMSRSSWMMGGGKMETKMDVDHGQKVGSHIKMNGKILGIRLFLDEVVTKREVPKLKE